MLPKIKLATMLSLTIVLFSCKKDASSSGEITKKTTIQFTVKDSYGISLSGASVYLYKTKSDLLSDINTVGVSDPTNSSGVTSITGLSAGTYYFLAEKDCQNNILDLKTVTVTANNTAYAYISLEKTGTLVFKNTSSNPYMVYVNGIIEYPSMLGGATNILFAKAGTYDVRVVQLSGYVLYPTDKSYTGSLSCGGTLTTTFP